MRSRVIKTPTIRPAGLSFTGFSRFTTNDEQMLYALKAINTKDH